VLAMDVARDDQELLVVTENGYGKAHPDPRLPDQGARDDGRQDDHDHGEEGASSPGALVVREHQELVFISQNGMVQAHLRARGSTSTGDRLRACA